MKICLGTILMCHQIIITIKVTVLLLILLTTATLLSATCFLVVVFCLEVSEPIPYTKGGHIVHIAQKRAMAKKGQKF